jgi:hypothetical protein
LLCIHGRYFFLELLLPIQLLLIANRLLFAQKEVVPVRLAVLPTVLVQTAAQEGSLPLTPYRRRVAILEFWQMAGYRQPVEAVAQEQHPFVLLAQRGILDSLIMYPQLMWRTWVVVVVVLVVQPRGTRLFSEQAQDKRGLLIQGVVDLPDRGLLLLLRQHTRGHSTSDSVAAKENILNLLLIPLLPRIPTQLGRGEQQVQPELLDMPVVLVVLATSSLMNITKG